MEPTNPDAVHNHEGDPETSPDSGASPGFPASSLQVASAYHESESRHSIAHKCPTGRLPRHRGCRDAGFLGNPPILDGVDLAHSCTVKTEVRCPPITEVRCPLFTGYRVQSSRMMRVWECGHLARREMSKVRRTGISTRRRSVMLMPPRSPRPLSCVGRASRPFSFPVAGSSRL